MKEKYTIRMNHNITKRKAEAPEDTSNDTGRRGYRRNNRRIIFLLLYLVLLYLTAGCASDDGFTLEDMARANTLDTVFSEYASVRTESKVFNAELPDGRMGDYTQTSVCIRGHEGNAAYFDSGDWGLTTVENGNVYQLNADGSCDIVGFFDDGLYEELYQPFLEWFVYAPTEGEEMVSVSVEKGIRTVTTHTPITDESAESYEAEAVGGTVETVYMLDVNTGRILRSEEYIQTADGERRQTAAVEVFYGENDSFSPPEYVARCKDRTETRTVRCVMSPGEPEEKTFTFTVPKKANIIPLPAEEYAYFIDADCTLPYETPIGGYPDEYTLYMRKAGT